jgi:hypothetical protein
MFLQKQLLYTAIFLLSVFNLQAQQHTKAFQISDLSSSLGKWSGSLTYLDYSSGKPYTMPADIIISFAVNPAGYIMTYEYPKEPKANSVDTTYLKDHYFGKEKVIQFNKKSSGDFILITAYEGKDGNDNKKAVLRHTYTLEGNSFSMKKDVQFKGTSKWIQRHEYLLTKEKKVTIIDKSLFDSIAQMDSLMFAAYNTQNLTVMKTYFTKDLEWYQDNGGLLNYETVFTNFQSIFDRPEKLSRELVKGTLEVIPVKNFGAIEIGQHRFKHMENGKLEVGTFRFVMIWKNDNGNWKISRVISFDH